MLRLASIHMKNEFKAESSFSIPPKMRIVIPRFI